MKKEGLFALWGGLFVICAGLGFVPNPDGAVKWLMTALAVLFFVPPFVLTVYSAKTGDRQTLELVRNLSFASLVLTAAMLVANFLSFAASEALGNMLYSALIVISSPMVCGGAWALSLFLWACLMVMAITKLRKK